MTDLKKRLLSQLQAPFTSDPETLAPAGVRLRGGFSLPASKAIDDSAKAAVLIACLDGPEPSVVLTVRAHQVPHHAGQVALPGGRYHMGEAFPVATALREAEEEIGLLADDVEILGLLDPVATSTGFCMVPVVGWVSNETRLCACEREVSALFQMPLAQVLDPALYSTHRLRFQANGQHVLEHRLWRLRSNHWPIWGATAHALAKLAGLSEDALPT